MDNRRLGRDLLSDLPVNIIESNQSILMLLPIRDAIRTSILSSKWRYRWTSLPQLVFHEIEDTINEDCLKIFVTRTLLCHEGPIHKFKLHALTIDSCPDTDQWLLLLSTKDIKELILEIEEGPFHYFIVPSCLYSCRNLTYLELFGCEFGPPPPTFMGFLCLRSLILRYVDVPPNAIESIVANSPLLENLECTHVGLSELRIRLSAPNLKYLHLGCIVKEIHLCAPLLAKMSVTFFDEDDSSYRVELPQPKHSVCNYTKFLGGFTNLESLTGDEYFTKYLSIGIEYCHHPLVLHQLKVITLCRVNFNDMDEILVVIRLIMDAANLRELQVRSCVYYFNVGDASKVPHLHFWDSDCPQNCTFQKLKVIKMTIFRGSLTEMKFIKFLLESSPVLETMIIEPTQSLTKNRLFELLSYCRASANAKILFTEKLKAHSA